MPRKTLSGAFRQTAIRRLIEEAATNDMDFNQFYTKASQLGLNTDPQVLNYANVLKEKENKIQDLIQKKQQSQRDQEISSISQEAMQGRPYEMEPIQSQQRYRDMPIPEAGQEQRTPGGDLRLPEGRMPELEMQPTGIAKQGFAPAESFEQAYRRMPQIAQERGVQPPTVKEAEQYVPLQEQKDVVGQGMQERKQDFEEDIGKKKLDLERDRVNLLRDKTEQMQRRINENRGNVERELLEEQLNDQYEYLKILQSERDDVNKQLKGELYEVDDTTKENLKIKQKKLQSKINELLKHIPANTQWIRLKQQQPGDYTNRGGIISRDGARSNVSNAGQNAKVEQAKAVIRQLESKPSLTPQEQADLEELKRFVGEPVQQFGQTRQRTPVRGNLPELQTETVMGNTTLPGSTGNR